MSETREYVRFRTIKKLETVAFPMENDAVDLKVQIGVIDFLTTYNVLGSSVMVGNLTYKRTRTYELHQEKQIDVDFEEGSAKYAFEIRIKEITDIIRKRKSLSEEETSLVEISFKSTNRTVSSEMEKLSKDFVHCVTEAIKNLPDELSALEKNLSEKQQTLNEKVERKKNAAGNASIVSFLVIIASVILMICFFIWGVFFNSAPAESTSQEEEMQEKLEFADNIDTPGTSEYKWYHEEYLSDNDYPDN